MAKVKLITGYVPIGGHPRTSAEYGALGEKLAQVRSVPLKAFYRSLSNCWLYQWAMAQRSPITPEEGDNRAKNSLAYHAVNHQKTEWLAQAAVEDPYPDVFVWIDYGIFHLPGVTAEIIEDFAARIAENDLAIPGCWNRAIVPQHDPCWRFCGSVLICPRPLVAPLAAGVMSTALKHMKLSRRAEWEVNTWARLEQTDRLPIRWYKADHNSTLFTAYEAPNAGQTSD